jgi:2-keto-4-pentenoate hydratase/2-oxohepta-3-ene-1,7-dioic acid hydratase in catechol pathway
MKIFCVGRNYADHAKELGNIIPDEPVIFMKPKSALLQPQEKFANKYYDAVTVGIDFTARDIQNELKEKGLPWERAKAWDNSAAIGKWIPFQNLKNKKEISFGLYKNKELVQEGNSKDMMFDFDYIVSFISNFFSINIGDLIFTGTPAGVGEAVVGDELEGFLENESLFVLEVK